MRQSIRPATPEEENIVNTLLAKGEILLGVHEDQQQCSVRQPCGTLRFIDCCKLKPSWQQKLKKLFGL